MSPVLWWVSGWWAAQILLFRYSNYTIVYDEGSGESCGFSFWRC